MALLQFSAGLYGSALLQLAWAAQASQPSQHYCAVIDNHLPGPCRPVPSTFLGDLPHADEYIANDLLANTTILDSAYGALVVLQEDFFDGDFGAWPTSIDWTGAVIGTVISGMLNTLSKSLEFVELNDAAGWKAKENLVSSFFAQIVNSFFGQDVLAMRGQAYDDMLWVVLGWLETIQFVDNHASRQYPANSQNERINSHELRDALKSAMWHGQTWTHSFAHRSRIFWELGSDGWETRLCHGGMLWNRRLLPYKNAITNELWISASISMYQYFPGDNFTAPWLMDATFPPRNPLHLASAIEGYKWLRGINMMNKQGLYADGFHIDRSKPGNTECDVRNEMVYTYNQGVILTGQRGLWAVSGIPSYLEEGHTLIQSVIKATGWSLVDNAPNIEHSSPLLESLPPWRGLGRGGILEERCDASGTCSQDGQTFKSIFFHHFTAFCAPLEAFAQEGPSVNATALSRVEDAHAAACRSYTGWARHNALAALQTRDADGHFGMWWGAGVFNSTLVAPGDEGIDYTAANTTDYRNKGTPFDETWSLEDQWTPSTGGWKMTDNVLLSSSRSGQQVMSTARTKPHTAQQRSMDPGVSGNPNDRGRGRTVETQIGGLSVLRAYWELSQSYRTP
ncbi:hypothetical protein S40288_02467 [Stachybotrys chartarum IBT 40288]|nr:hypothetical protein S40288_02467 [Stachybotrys chartarum IBT 40288]